MIVNFWTLLVVLVIAASYIISLVLLFFVQEKLIFFPSTLPADYKFHYSSLFEERYVRVGDEKMHSLLFRTADPKGLILFFHGNAGSLAEWGGVAEEISQRTHWNVWIIDYPSYGKSEGRIHSEEQLIEMAKAFYEEARKEYDPEMKIVVYGRSIGSGLAVKLASENQIAGLILEAPFLSLEKLAFSKAPWAPPFLLSYTFRSDKWIGNVKCPIIIIHGQKDDVIPFEQARTLASLGKNVTFVPIPSGDHNNLSSYMDYWMYLQKFLEHISVKSSRKFSHLDQN